MSANSYDLYYLANPNGFGREPSKFLAKWVRELQVREGACALDIGCGTGRNALFLAESGYVVTAVDISERAIQTLQKSKEAALNRASINCVCSDIRNWTMPTDHFSLVLAYTCLDHLDRKSAQSIIERVYRSLKISGHFLVAVFSENDPSVGSPEPGVTASETAAMIVNPYSEEDLRISLASSKTLHEQKISFVDTHHGTPHQHVMLQTVVKKI